jgi:chromosomal replication initiation ATPase DnaA
MAMIDMGAQAPRSTPITARRIIEIVSRHTGVSVEEIKGHRRNLALIHARHIATLLVRYHRPDLSYPQIGKVFGGRDHSTIIHGNKVILERIKRNPDLAETAQDAEFDVVYEAYFARREMVG